MKKIFERKTTIGITSVSLLFALICLIYAIRQKNNIEEKVLMAQVDIAKRLKPISEQDSFPPPSKSDLMRTNKNTCIGIANQIDFNTYSTNDYGNLTRVYAVMILKELAQNMRDGENLSEYLDRKR